MTLERKNQRENYTSLKSLCEDTIKRAEEEKMTNKIIEEKLKVNLIN